MSLPDEITPKILEEFYRLLVRGNEHDCWLSSGFSLSFKGYPQWTHYAEDGTVHTIPAHRLAYVLFNGPLAEGEQIRHLCSGNPWCVAPHHLAAGTARDNVLDTIAAGRRRKTPRKYTEAQALKARRLYRQGLTMRAVAAATGTSFGFVDDVVHGRGWSHLGGKIERRTEYDVNELGQKVARYVFVKEHPPKAALPDDYNPIGVEAGPVILPEMPDKCVFDLKVFRSLGVHAVKVARMFCVTPSIVRAIDRGELYAHVAGPKPSRRETSATRPHAPTLPLKRPVKRPVRQAKAGDA